LRREGAIRVLHVISGLKAHGAEMMLYKLLCSMDRTRFDPVVMSLGVADTLRDRIESLGIPVRRLGMSSRRPYHLPLLTMRRIARDIAPDVIQGWMYHGNVFANLMRRLSPGNPAVLWNVRHSVYDIGQEKPLMRQLIRFGARLSSGVDAVIYNSKLSAKQHEAMGYCAAKTRHLPNGFDTSVFMPSDTARSHLRAKLKLAENTMLVGVVGRFHPMKDHANFFKAAGLVKARYQDAQFICIGQGLSVDNPNVHQLVAEEGLEADVHLLGEQDDIATAMAALDVLCSSSWSESFPNVLGEAMACGVPCVATDVGDCSSMLGGLGEIVPARDASALAKGIVRLLDLGDEARKALGMQARQRVIDHFSLAAIAGQHESLYLEICAKRST